MTICEKTYTQMERSNIKLRIFIAFDYQKILFEQEKERQVEADKLTKCLGLTNLHSESEGLRYQDWEVLAVGFLK